MRLHSSHTQKKLCIKNRSLVKYVFRFSFFFLLSIACVCHGNREQYLCDLAKLHRLTSRTNLETKKQQKLQQSLDELRRQTKIAEEELLQQKLIITQKLRPAILTAEKTANTNRIAMQKLENCCNRLGNIVNGADYK